MCEKVKRNFASLKGKCWSGKVPTQFYVSAEAFKEAIVIGIAGPTIAEIFQ